MLKRLTLVFGLGLLFLPAAALAGFSADAGRTNETIQVGRFLNLSLNPGAWSVAYNNNPQSLAAEIVQNSLKVQGLKAGLGSAMACEQTTGKCFLLTVTVIDSNVLGAATPPQSLNAPHPVGSFVNSGKTVYYVHETGLIPISTWPIYLSVRGKNKTIIEGNNYDFQLPLLPLMTNKDSRVK